MSTNHCLHALTPSVLSAAALSLLTGGASVTPVGAGRFEALFTLGSKSLAVLHEESRSVPEFPWRHHATLRRLR